MKRLTLFTLVILAALALAACGTAAATQAPQAQATPATDGAPASGGGAASAALTLDPANLSETEREAAAYLYDGLVMVKDGEIVPALAESFQVSDDGLEYTFTLRSGLTFHDGAALNADAVIANFNRWYDPKDTNRGAGAYAAWKSAFGGFKGEASAEGKPVSQYDGIEKINDLTILVHLNTPDPEFLGKLADVSFAIVSPAAFGGAADGGAGAYQFESSNGATLKVQPFAAYWNGAPASGAEVPLK